MSLKVGNILNFPSVLIVLLVPLLLRLSLGPAPFHSSSQLIPSRSICLWHFHRKAINVWVLFKRSQTTRHLTLQTGEGTLLLITCLPIEQRH